MVGGMRNCCTCKEEKETCHTMWHIRSGDVAAAPDPLISGVLGGEVKGVSRAGHSFILCQPPWTVLHAPLLPPILYCTARLENLSTG